MLSDIDIIEIGGGYGGLCFYMHNLANLFNITITSFSIFDLQSPLQLQQKYLENINIDNVNYVSIDDIKNIKENSFLISNYAFSEISLELQQEYTKQILNPYTSHGFVTWNMRSFYKFIDDKNISMEQEYPLTGGGNLYITFKPLKI